MDSLTHLFTGLLLAEAGPRRYAGNAARVLAVTMSILPDLDYVLYAWGMDCYIRWHRSFSHSLPVVVPVGIAVGIAGAILLRRRDLTGTLVRLSLTCLVVHLLLDCFTSYGTQLFWPLSEVRQAWDILFIIDPFFTIPVVAVVLCCVCSSRVLGAVRLARAGLVYLVFYLVACISLHQFALAKAERVWIQGGVHARISRCAVLPAAGGPWRWRALAALGRQGIHILRINLLTGEVSLPQAVYCWPDNRLLGKAEQRPVVKLFRKFARFPVRNFHRLADGFLIEYYDLRFESFGGNIPFRLCLLYTRDGRLLQEKFYHLKALPESVGRKGGC